MTESSLQLLQRLIATPSVSREETAAADIVECHLRQAGIDVRRIHNNVWATNRHFSPGRPTLLLNSHIDTVRTAASWTRDPHSPDIADGRLYGLGSNDAGASVVSLIAIFCEYYDSHLPFNLLLAITAEEEVMGEKGMRAFLPHLKEQGIGIDIALVGEPTGMRPAIGERGLLVLDAVTRGVSGHAARDEGVNALYKAIADIDRLRNFKFPRQSAGLGPVKISVTQIECGTQHNVIPDICRWVVDVRTTDAYNNEQTARMLDEAVESQLTPRSTRVWASLIDAAHPLRMAAEKAAGESFVSPTTSDMALMHDIPSLKIGPGLSARSHTADEYIRIDELEEAPSVYRNILNNLSKILHA